MKHIAKSITESYDGEAAQLLSIYGANFRNTRPLADWILAHATDSEAGVMVGRDGEPVATVRVEFDGEEDTWRVEEALDPRADGEVGELAEGEHLAALRQIFGRPLILATVRNFTVAREPEAE